MQSSLCILVTRPDPGGAELCAHVQAAGDVALHLPTIAFAPPRDVIAFERGIDATGEQDWLIFVSPQAVRASVPALRRHWPLMPARVQFVAIGAGTAKAIREAGYQVAFQPAEEWSSEGLMESEMFQSVDSQAVMIIRGEGGREVLEVLFGERGAKVSSLTAYERTLPEIDFAPYLPLLRDHKIDLVVCTSFEGVRNLKSMVGDNGWAALRQIPLLVVSERIKALAQAAGFQTIWVAGHAGHEAILAAIADKRKELCQKRMND